MSNFTNQQIFKELEGKTLTYLLKKSCHENDLDKIKYIFESDVLEEIFGLGKSAVLSDTLEEIERIILDSDLIKKCCELNNLEILKYLLPYCDGINAFTIEELKSQIDDGAVIACQKDAVEILDYLLHSKEIQHHAKIHDDLVFFSACSNNSIRILEYAFKLPQLKDFLNTSNELINLACAYSDLNIIKFIMNHPDVKDKIDIHGEEDYPFTLLLNNRKEEAIKYFIFDLKIEKTDYITTLLKERNKPHVEKMFETRDLKNELHTELKDNNDIANKKIKL